MLAILLGNTPFRDETPAPGRQFPGQPPSPGNPASNQPLPAADSQEGSARALRERIAQGRVYATEKISTALTNFFRTENLTALRALALREVAEEQEADQPRGGAGRAPAVAERVLV